MSWLREERGELAAGRILDAAGRLFAERGVAATGMGDVARAAGCSRATLYRYFETRDDLRAAYVHRAARRIGAEVAAEVAGVADLTERLVVAVLAALGRVRGDPTLAAWFTAVDSPLAASIGRSSAVIESMVAAFLAAPAADPGGSGGARRAGGARGAGGAGGAPAGGDVAERARWVVRVVLSLLALPGADQAEERHLLEAFVAPVIVAPAVLPGRAPQADASS